MGNLEKSSQVYALKTYYDPDNQKSGSLTLSGNTVNINYKAGSTSLFIHELTHAGQFENGDVAFDRITGNAYFIDVADELEAYQAQFCFDTNLDPQMVNIQWLLDMKDMNGNYLYRQGGLFHTLQLGGINVNTPYFILYTLATGKPGLIEPKKPKSFWMKPYNSPFLYKK